MSVNILLAIKWIKEAWEEVGPDTIGNCFRHCGAILDVEHQIERELSDPFADLDADCDVHTLDVLLSQMDCGLTADQYVNEDGDVPTHLTFEEKICEKASKLTICCSGGLSGKASRIERK